MSKLNWFKKQTTRLNSKRLKHFKRSGLTFPYIKSIKLSTNLNVQKLTKFNIQLGSPAFKFFSEIDKSFRDRASYDANNVLVAEWTTRPPRTFLFRLPARTSLTRSRYTPNTRLNKVKYFIGVASKLTRLKNTPLIKVRTSANTPLNPVRVNAAVSAALYKNTPFMKTSFRKSLAALVARRILLSQKYTILAPQHPSNQGEFIESAKLKTELKQNVNIEKVLFLHAIDKPSIIKYVASKYSLSDPWFTDMRNFRALDFPKAGRYARTAQSWLRKTTAFASLYAHFTPYPRTESYIAIRDAQKVAVIHKLYFRFNKHRLVISLTDEKYQRTHFTLAIGLFLRYFQYRKSLRKNKALKILLARFLRKILVTVKLKDIHLILRGVPLYLDLLLSTMFKPLSHPFKDPLTGDVVDETTQAKLPISFSEVRFIRFKPFGYQKTRKKGRIKRKIKRKIVRTAPVID